MEIDIQKKTKIIISLNITTIMIIIMMMMRIIKTATKRPRISL